MKYLIAIIISLLASVGSTYSQGVTYYQGDNIYTALNQAQKEKKLLFVEFYAPWNYKSTWMHKMMNSSTAISQLLAENFIVFQFDTESTEGAKYANTYSVTDYPCLLVFGRNGDVIDKIDQTLDPDDFLEKINQTIFNTDGNAVWRLRQLLTAAENLRFEDINRLFINLQTQYGEKLINRTYWHIFDNTTITYYYSPAFDFLLNNADAFRLEIGDETVNKSLVRIFANAIQPYLLAKHTVDTTVLMDVKRLILSAGITSHELELSLVAVHYRADKEAGKYLATITQLRNIYPEDMGLSLVLTLDWIAEMNVRDYNQLAKKIIEDQMKRTSIPLQLELLQSLLDKF